MYKGTVLGVFKIVFWHYRLREIVLYSDIQTVIVYNSYRLQVGVREVSNIRVWRKLLYLTVVIGFTGNGLRDLGPFKTTKGH